MRQIMQKLRKLRLRKREREDLKKDRELIEQAEQSKATQLDPAIILKMKIQYGIPDTDIDNKDHKEIISVCQQAIKAKEQQLNDVLVPDIEERERLRQDISAEKSSFYQQFGELNKINQELKFQYDQLKNFRTEATDVFLAPFSNSPTAEEQTAFDEASSFLKLVSDKMLSDLKHQLDVQKKAIDTILERLEAFHKNQPDALVQGVVSDTI